MNAFDLIEALRFRNVSFKVFRNALKAEDLPVSTGWDETIRKLEPIAKSAETRRQFEISINRIHNDLTLFCDKAVIRFSLEGNLAIRLLNVLVDGFVNEESPYTRNFPYPLPREELIIAPIEIHCTSIWRRESAIDVLFCAKMYLTERAELPVDSLDEDAKENFGMFDSLVGIRRTPVQLYDSLTVSIESNYLEIRVDGIKRFNSDDAERRMNRIKQIVAARFKDVYGEDLALGFPLNFYPALKYLYNEADGVVGELGHTTDAAGIYKEKMRHKSKDVRDDPYHNGGAEAVDDLNIHSISKHWPSPSGFGYPEVEIPSRYSLASEQDPMLSVVHMLNCASSEDYQFVMSKIII